MSFPRLTRGGWYALGVTILLLAGVSFYLSWVRIPGRERYFLQTRFRALGVLAQQLEGALDGRVGALNQLQYKFRFQEEDPQAYEKALIAQLEEMKLNPLDCSWTSSSVFDVVPEPVDSPSSLSTDWTLGSPITQKANSRVVFLIKGLFSCATSRLDEIVLPLLRGSALGNDELFIADRKGRVLFERGMGAVRLERFPRGAAKSPEESKSKTPAPTATPTATPAGDGGLPSIDDLSIASKVTAVTVSGIQYKLLSYPVRIPSGDLEPVASLSRNPEAGDDLWVVGLLVRAADLQSEARRISLGAWGNLPLLGLIIFLAIPGLKLRFLGSRARVGASDVYRLAFSMIAATAVAGTVAVANYDYRWLEKVLEQQLRAWGGDIEQAFRGELSESTLLVERVADWARSSPLRHDWNHDECIATSLGTVHQKIAGDCNPVLIDSLHDQLRYARIVFWTDKHGQQREKWTSEAQSTTFINIKEISGSSFPEIEAGRLSSLSLGGSVPVQVVLRRSPTLGDLTPTVSIRIEEGDEFLGVAAVVPRLASVREAVVPAGFGFAIVQTDGQVVFHSTPERNLYENFFLESDRPGALQAAVLSRQQRFIEGEYHGRAHQFYVQPLAELPWSLVVFRDKELVNTLDLNILMTWLLAFAGYVLIPLVGFFLYRAIAHSIFPGSSSSWLWPDQRKGARYLVCGAILFGLLAVSLATVLYSRTSSAPMLATVVSLALLGLNFAYLILDESAEIGSRRRTTRAASWVAVIVALGVIAVSACSRSGDRRFIAFAAVTALASVLFMIWSESPCRTRAESADRNQGLVRRIVVFTGALAERVWRLGYLLVGLFLIALTGLVPSLALYRDAFDLGMDVMVRHGQIALAEQLARREEGIRERNLKRKEVDPPPVDDPRGLPSAPLLWQRGLPTDASVGAANQEVECPTGAMAWLLGSFTRANERTAGAIEPCSCSGWCESILRHPASLLMAWLPAYHSESIALRDLIQERAADGLWSWGKTDEGGGQRAVLSFHSALSTSPDCCTLISEDSVPTWPLPLTPVEKVFFCIMATIGSAGVLALIGWIASYVFDWRGDGAADSPTRPDGLAAFGESWDRADGALLVSPSIGTTRWVRSHLGEVIDLYEFDYPLSGREVIARCGDHKRIVIDNFSHRIEDARSNRSKLSLLERLILAEKRKVIIISRIDPVSYFQRRLQSPGDDKADEGYVTNEEIDRWARVFERLAKVPPPAATGFDGSKTIEGGLTAFFHWIMSTSLRPPVEWDQKVTAWQNSKTGDLVSEECWPTARLRAIGGEILFRRPLSSTTDQIMREIGSLARAHYRSLWTTLTDEQRLALIHLAETGYANPKTWPIIGGLVERGLVRRTPAPRLMNRSFASFVAEVETREQIGKWEKAAGPSHWDRLRSGLLIVAVIIAVVLFVTKPDVLTYWVGGLSAVGAAVATLANLLGFFRGQRETATRQA